MHNGSYIQRSSTRPSYKKRSSSHCFDDGKWCWQPEPPDPPPRPRPPEPQPEEKECKVNICTNITVNQKNNSEANGGQGGIGGGAQSQTAATVATGEGHARSCLDQRASTDQIQNTENEPEPNGTKDPRCFGHTEAEIEDAEALLTRPCPTVTGGPATGGSGGAGGTGGENNSAQCNTATIAVENVVVLCCNGDSPPHNMTIGLNGRKMDIFMDEDGSTFVNGKKMDAENLEDGTKVYIISKSESNDDQ